MSTRARPAKPGGFHVCGQQCPCGHWSQTLRSSGRTTRGRISLDNYEQYDDRVSGGAGTVH